MNTLTATPASEPTPARIAPGTYDATLTTDSGRRAGKVTVTADRINFTPDA